MNHFRTYGVTRNIRSEIKLHGVVTLNDAALYVVFGLLALLLGNVFPPTMSNLKITFYVVMLVFAIWLTMKPVSNPDKRNYQIMIFMLKRQQTYFKSLDQNQNPDIITILKHSSAGKTHQMKHKRR